MFRIGSSFIFDNLVKPYNCKYGTSNSNIIIIITLPNHDIQYY